MRDMTMLDKNLITDKAPVMKINLPNSSKKLTNLDEYFDKGARYPFQNVTCVNVLKY